MADRILGCVLGLVWAATLAGFAQPGLAQGGAPAPAADTGTPAAAAREILQATGIRGGLVVHLGCGDGQLTAALRVSGAYIVQGLDRDPQLVAAARRRLQALGIYGPVSIDQHTGSRLPYIDNLVNLLVVEDASEVSRDELLRVLAPQGVAYLKSGTRVTQLTKPRPPELDEWTHYLHDPSNNAVAHDAAIGPPRRVQWTSGPAWSRHHDHMASLSALVSTQNRIFYILDEGPREAILLPSQWQLIARDAFNGTILWKRAIDEWNTQLWPLKSGPNQLPRRLVASGDRVYVTLGIDAALTALDAATGQTLRTYPGTEQTDEILASEGVLYLVVAPMPNKWKEYRPADTYVWANSQRANKDWAWDQVPRMLLAVQAETGQVLWKQERRVAPLTLTVDRQHVYFYDGERALSLSRQTGAEVWKSEPVLRKLRFPTGYGPTLVAHQDVVLLSVENRSVTALATADGKTLWTSEHHPGGHASPDDLLIINGLVWSAAVANGQSSGVVTGRDLHTGEVKREFLPDVQPDWFHHRCYRSRATDKYFIPSRTGIEFIDLEAQHWDINHWVRGGCLYGFMPSNGLLYVPPHACGCFLESKLFNFNALAAEPPAKAAPVKVQERDRLVTGPAYTVDKDPAPPAASAAADWPTYRHDALRSGAASTTVSAPLERVWQAQLGGKLSSPTVANGQVFVAAVDTHTVHALDAQSGQRVWSFTAAGRVDSPPTIFRGRVLFGSADGGVYCLRASDGQLSWRFRAAPEDRRLMAFEQLESAWPVSGSVLIHNGVLYCVAGRSAFLDGGLRLLRLDPLTGRKLSETVLDERDPETGENLQAKIKGQDMPVALPDILSCDGQSVYMRSQAFDLEGIRRELAPLKTAGQAGGDGEGAHLFSRSGFLDDSWFFRSYWVYGKTVDGNYGGWLRAGHFAPCGRLLVLGEKAVYGFDRKPEYLCNASVQEYYLYAAERAVQPESIQRVQAAERRINAASPQKAAAVSDWATRKKFSLTDQNVSTFKWALGNPPLQARALVLAGQTLFVAGPPDVVNEEEALQKPDDAAIRQKLAAQVAALRGAAGAQLLAIAAADGRQLGAYELGALPTFDGMAAAQGRLYLSTVDGRVLCLGGSGTPLASLVQAPLAPLDISVKPLAEDAPLHPGPNLNGDFATVLRAEVTRAELGYHVHAAAKGIGLVLKKQTPPLTGKCEFKTRMKIANDGELRNGFLVFGDSPEDAKLTKCGLRYAMQKAVIIDGPATGGKTAQQEFAADDAKVYELVVNVDLATGQVTLKSGSLNLTAMLTQPPKRISYVGYGAINSATDFSPLEISAK